MNLTVFKSEAKQIPHEVLREVANFLLEFTLLRVNHVPKNLFRASELVSVMAEVAYETAADVAKPTLVTSIGRLHQLVISVHELIGMYFTRPNENPWLSVDTYPRLL
jgi:hypothetical protein